jgi:hypothetical protein
MREVRAPCPPSTLQMLLTGSIRPFSGSPCAHQPWVMITWQLDKQHSAIEKLCDSFLESSTDLTPELVSRAIYAHMTHMAESQCDVQFHIVSRADRAFRMYHGTLPRALRATDPFLQPGPSHHRTFLINWPFVHCTFTGGKKRAEMLANVQAKYVPRVLIGLFCLFVLVVTQLGLAIALVASAMPAGLAHAGVAKVQATRMPVTPSALASFL